MEDTCGGMEERLRDAIHLAVIWAILAHSHNKAPSRGFTDMVDAFLWVEKGYGFNKPPADLNLSNYNSTIRHLQGTRTLMLPKQRVASSNLVARSKFVLGSSI